MGLSYDLFLEPDVHEARHTLPGNMRQRVRRLIDDLAANRHPPSSIALGIEGLDLSPNVAIRRVRIDRWRVVYAVNAVDQWVWVLAIRRRPPYNYEDLPELVRKLQ
jgi:mRNA-degrading endonuclease RelE of RelBE toxin-antitoxin system